MWDFMCVATSSPPHRLSAVCAAFASDLSKAGLKDVTAMDYSSSAIGIQKKNNSRPGLKFEVP